MNVDIQLNDTCSVVLTQRGADILNKRMHPDAIRYSEGDVLTVSVMELMHEFGDFVFTGCVAPFKADMIVFGGK